MADGRYIDIAGHAHWLIEAGTGAPLVLLHGGLDSSEAFMAAIGTRLAASRRVIAFDRIGHGRTADRDGPFHYADMATETAGLIEALGLGPVDLCGWSDGGIIGLEMGLSHAQLVRRMVLIGANSHYDAVATEGFDRDAPWLVRAGAKYAALSPDGAGHFAAHVDKTLALWRGEPAFDRSALGRIGTPTLVLNGDRDELIPLAHTVQLFEAIPQAQLAIVPGAGHAVPATHSALTAALIETFLGAAEEQI